MCYKCDVNLNDSLYDITHVNNTDLPDLIHKGLIKASADVFCAWKCSDVLRGFVSDKTENILYDVCVD